MMQINGNLYTQTIVVKWGKRAAILPVQCSMRTVNEAQERRKLLMPVDFTERPGVIGRLSKSAFSLRFLADLTEKRAVVPVTGLSNRAGPEALTHAPME